MVPKADIVFDKFHVSKHLNEAVDTVHRREEKRLLREEDDSLTGTRQLWLYAPRNSSEGQQARFEKVKQSDLKTAKASLDDWFRRGIRTNLTPLNKFARTIKERLSNLTNYFLLDITNAVAEVSNSKNMSIKRRVGGFRNRDKFKTAILFYCGVLDFRPRETKMAHKIPNIFYFT
jgi:transposase